MIKQDDRSFSIFHLGAEHCVTGSCHLIQVRGLNILVDCGLAQGHDAVIPFSQWPVPPSAIQYLFLTHAHIDHIGRLPLLIQEAFCGEVITTHPTQQLILPMLRDAMGFSDIAPADAEKIERRIEAQTWGFEYDERFDLEKGIRFKLGKAGHILGSCFIRFEIEPSGESVLFSGDLGHKGSPILPDPDIPDPADYLILESTYGDRHHPPETDRIRQLGAVLSRALSDGGKVFIPAFALGRTQELIYEMDRLATTPEYQRAFPSLGPGRRPPVFVDSPLGLQITDIYSTLSPFWDQEARDLLVQGDHPLDFKGLYAAKDGDAHRKLCGIPGPAIIIAGSGMCTGGRIVDHLKEGLPEAKNDICFVGFQAAGTLGRDILDQSKSAHPHVRMEGETIPIRAAVHALPGYSAHADQQGLVDWVGSMPDKPGRIKLVHGDNRAQTALATVLKDKGYEVSMG
jgi:metallo-beta-lactamase family protein